MKSNELAQKIATILVPIVVLPMARKRITMVVGAATDNLISVSDWQFVDAATDNLILVSDWQHQFSVWYKDILYKDILIFWFAIYPASNSYLLALNYYSDDMEDNLQMLYFNCNELVKRSNRFDSVFPAKSYVESIIKRMENLLVFI